MVTDDKPTEKRNRGHHAAFIPAGILIGLGVGLLLNYPGAGVLIGLGLGFIATSFVRHKVPDPATAAPPCGVLKGGHWIMFLIGIVLILIGIGFVWKPLLIWPNLIAIILILLGIGFAVRGFRK
jgi:hypothetical protein